MSDDHPRTDPQISFWWAVFLVVVGIACALVMAYAITRP